MVSGHQWDIHSQADSPIRECADKNNTLPKLRFLIIDKEISEWKGKRLKCQVMMVMYPILIYIMHHVSDRHTLPWHQFRQQAGLTMTRTTQNKRGMGVCWPLTKSFLCPLVARASAQVPPHPRASSSSPDTMDVRICTWQGLCKNYMYLHINYYRSQ